MLTAIYVYFCFVRYNQLNMISTSILYIQICKKQLDRKLIPKTAVRLSSGAKCKNRTQRKGNTKNIFLPGTLRQLLVFALCLVKNSSLLSPQPAEWSAICPSIVLLRKPTSAKKWQRGSLDILSSYSSLID